MTAASEVACDGATSVGAWLADRRSIGLGELEAEAALQTRVDRKYAMPLRHVGALLSALDDDIRVLQIGDLRGFAYESLYFDTPDLVSYHLAARRRRRRFKVRTRTYLDSSLCWVEVKTRGARGSTVKDRLPHEADLRHDLEPGRWFVDEVFDRYALGGPDRSQLRPTLLNRYRRSTLFVPATRSRVTIDTDLIWQDGARELHLPDLAIIETKTGSAASCVDRLLWAQGQRPCRVSKYATGLAALRPDLPATPWRRTLQRHFSPT
jgi:hypothetical protein